MLLAIHADSEPASGNSTDTQVIESLFRRRFTILRDMKKSLALLFTVFIASAGLAQETKRLRLIRQLFRRHARIPRIGSRATKVL